MSLAVRRPARAIRERGPERLSKTEKPLSDAADKVKEDLREVPAKSGLAGTLVLIIIIAGIIGIVVLGIFLLTRR